MNPVPTVESILSCAMCVGGADGELAMAANMAIGLMLVFLVLVLGSFLLFIRFLAKKARLADQDDQSHQN